MTGRNRQTDRSKKKRVNASMVKSSENDRDYLIVRGAREHNLKNITVRIPRNRFVVITGLSGSGKSSLAYDTIYAEGQRRYVESLSSYARQFLEQMEKPDVDSIEGLSPAISIDQRKISRNPRSTVGTITEIYDYLRVLYARAGIPHCPGCGREISRQSVSQIVDTLSMEEEGTRLVIMAPMVRGKKGKHKALLNQLAGKGYTRIRLDGEIHGIDEDISINGNRKHDLEVVVDRLRIRPESRDRMADSVETALNAAGGVILALIGGDREVFFSLEHSCPYCNISFREISPRLFSFNSPYGACPECHGLGTTMDFSPEIIVPDRSLSIEDGAIASVGKLKDNWFGQRLRALSREYGFSLEAPFSELPGEAVDIILHGSDGEIVVKYDFEKGHGEYVTEWEGIIPNLRRRYHQTDSGRIRSWCEDFMTREKCSRCGGMRLREEGLAVTLNGMNITGVTDMSIEDISVFFRNLSFEGNRKMIAAPLMNEITERLDFLVNVGLDYLTLSRSADTLAGGEIQRIRLATQLGTKLVGVLYILDEPTIGLHQRDNARLISALKSMSEAGNTVVVIEHDRETIMAADHIIDLGPGAGELGGRLVAEGDSGSVMASKKSLTGRYLASEQYFELKDGSERDQGKELVLEGSRGNNLKGIDAEFPLGKLICVTGVSGSGKSTLVCDTLYAALRRMFYRSKSLPLEYGTIRGAEHIDKVVNIDQSPIGRTPRSNPATYTGIFTPVRKLFSELPVSRMRGYRPGRFSFNVKGGRCEECGGGGVRKIEMHFLPDVYVTCHKCGGKRYNRETLDVTYRNLNIAEVLDLTVDEAYNFFENIPAVKRRLKVLKDVGLGYIRLGQSATTLSGGEAQRVKLASELSRKGTGSTLYILDEPSTGLHFEDVKLLMNLLNRLVDRGNTVIVIEHNPDVIRHADHIIDLGPEGGARGGEIVFSGSPADILGCRSSYTGRILNKYVRKN
ncbi:MAG: excinuclease ABC subunit UvrA [Candidatus Krumholzibacteriales bacterium]